MTGSKIRIRMEAYDHQALDASAREIVLGLGRRTEVERLIITWPSGQRQTFEHLPAGRRIFLREGSPAVESRALAAR